jgi:hypothetical protein
MILSFGFEETFERQILLAIRFPGRWERKQFETRGPDTLLAVRLHKLNQDARPR